MAIKFPFLLNLQQVPVVFPFKSSAFELENILRYNVQLFQDELENRH
jgi:hypothetical protein